MTKHILTASISLLALGLVSCGSDVSTSTDGSKVAGKTNAPNAWCFSGGPIYTADENDSLGEAVVVTGNRISYVGSDDGDWCPKNAEKRDLAGAALYPGLTDAHGHLIGIGLREMTLNLEGTKSVADLQDRLRAEAEANPGNQTIYGRGWIETHWPEGRFPSRADLDAVVPDRSVILERADGHASVVNSYALEQAGITASTEDPFGGAINRDADGEATGMLIDNAQRFVDAQMPELDEARRREAYRRGAALYAARGWTNIHSMSVDRGDIALINEMAENGEIGIRVYNALGGLIGQEADLARRSIGTMKGGLSSDANLVTTRAIKLYADGALGSRGAALLLPYSDDPENEGLVTLDEDQAQAIFRAALRNGIQVCTHAIGDKGNRLVLDWYEDAFAAVPPAARAERDPRWRIEHSQILDPSDIARFNELGVIPSMQPSHAIGDLHFAVDRLGPDRLSGAYAWQALIDSGVKVAGGSDAPVEIGDPRIEFHAAMLRTDLKGYSNENWGADQAVSAQNALKMFTAWPAYAAFQEDDLGTIEVGKLADFSAFDRDFLADGAKPMDANPIFTMVDGKMVFEAK